MELFFFVKKGLSMLRKLLFGAALLAGVQYSFAENVSIESLFSKFNVSSLQALYSKLDKPLVLDVYGNGCPHCTRFAPVFSKVGVEAASQAYFASFNHTTSAGEQAKSMYGIQRIPYLIIVKDGSTRYSSVFTSNESAFRSLLRQNAGLNI